MEQQPADLFGIVQAYADYLRKSAIPKPFVRATPGSILTDGGIEVESCRVWANQEEIEVDGIHFLQEDSPHQIGAAG